jgi:exo-1,4-beta-D-glucosaminidase
LTALQTLPKVNLDAGGNISAAADGPLVHVTLKNPSANLAFQVRLGIQRSGQSDEILPVFWDDNYIELMPGETRELTAKYLPTADISGDVELHVSGWNVNPITLPLNGAGPAHLQSAGGTR